MQVNKKTVNLHHQNKQTYSVVVTHRFLVPLSGVRIPVGLQTILSEGGFCFIKTFKKIVLHQIISCTSEKKL